jgi:hypothetical protein
MERANDAALYQTEKAFGGVDMGNGAVGVVAGIAHGDFERLEAQGWQELGKQLLHFRLAG